MDHAHAHGDIALDIPLLFLMGLTVSLGHCVGMCGPLQAAVALRWQETRPGSLGARLLRYHLARVTSYVIIGGLFALLGSVGFLAGNARTWQGALSVAAAGLMLPVALGLLGLLSPQKWTEMHGIGDRVSHALLSRLGNRGRARGDWSLGMLNGFLPCGPVLAVALAAAPKPVWTGMLLMAAYGAGTLPVLLVWGAAASRIPAAVRRGFYRLSGILLLALAVQLALRGLAALGVVSHVEIGRFMLW